MVHSDPDLFSLDETFSRIKEIRIPIVYTGICYIETSDDAYRIIRIELKIGSEKKLVVVSAGGGKVGIFSSGGNS
jgi:predicted glycosyltransferase